MPATAGYLTWLKALPKRLGNPSSSWNSRQEISPWSFSMPETSTRRSLAATGKAVKTARSNVVMVRMGDSLAGKTGNHSDLILQFDTIEAPRRGARLCKLLDLK